MRGVTSNFITLKVTISPLDVNNHLFTNGYVPFLRH